MKTISEGTNHKAINIGDFNDLENYVFPHPRLGHNVEAKLFIGEILKSSGAEISFQKLPSNTQVPFLHKHNKHEEIYIFLSGEGKFQVDDAVFEISTGSIIRVSPKGNRTLKNESDLPMIYMVVQANANTLTGYNISDGYREGGEIKT